MEREPEKKLPRYLLAVEAILKDPPEPNVVIQLADEAVQEAMGAVKKRLGIEESDLDNPT